MKVPIAPGQELWVEPLGRLRCLGLQVPELQRPIDSERVDGIVRYQFERLKNNKSPLYIGPMVLARRRNDDRTLWLLDGQHRFESMKRIAEEAPDHPVHLLVIDVGDTATMAEAFQLINASVPVPMYVIEGTLHAVRRKTLDEFRQVFAQEFGPFLSKTNMPRRPNVNLVQLQDRIHRCDQVMEEFSDGLTLFDFVLWVNDHLACADEATAGKARTKAAQRRSKALYVTCDPDYAWLSDAQWLDAYRTNRAPPVGKPSKPSGGRPQVPAALRAALWNAEFGERAGVGQCACCRREVTQQCFHAGHVVSVADGGATALNNLVVLCVLCNTSMGAKGFDEFSRAFRAGDAGQKPAA